MRNGIGLCAALLLVAATLACGGRTGPSAEAVREPAFAHEDGGNASETATPASVSPETNPAENREADRETEPAMNRATDRKTDLAENRKADPETDPAKNQEPDPETDSAMNQATDPDTDLTANPPTPPDAKTLDMAVEIEKIGSDAAPAKTVLPIPENVKDQPEDAGQPAPGPVKTSVSAEQTGETVVIDFSLTNISGRELTIVHGSGQRYDISAYNERNEEVFRWSHDKAFIAAVITEKLGRDERVTYREEWDMRDLKGEPVPAGNYRIVVQVLAGTEEVRVEPGDLTAETNLEIKR